MANYNRKPTLDKTILSFVETLKDNKTDNTKKDNIMYLFNRVENDCGAYGKIAEIMNGGKRKKAVSKQGKNDIYFSLEINGSIKRVRAENKTNGGRIGSLLDGSNGCKFVVYSMDVCNTGTNGVLRHLDPVIMPVEMFVDLLENVGAIKAVNEKGKFADWGIQVTSKELFLRLCEYPIVFNPSTVYTLDDFDGIEI